MKLLSYPNIACLFICQILFIITISVDLTYTGLTGFQLASNKDFATLPYALITLATAFTTLFVAVVTNAIGYAIMMFVMTATPIAMMKAHHDIHYSTSVIQLHMIGMFATSFVTGKVISALGEIKVIFLGLLFNALCAIIMIFYDSVPSFFIALLFLGVGWNFMFISGSSLLVRSYLSQHKYIMQSISEFTTFTFSAVGSLSAGWILNTYSWITINLCILPLLILPIVSMLYYGYYMNHAKSCL